MLRTILKHVGTPNTVRGEVRRNLNRVQGRVRIACARAIGFVNFNLPDTTNHGQSDF